MRNICAVFLKQINETFKNKTILIQFVLFPAFALIMENAIKLQDMPEHFFVKLFSVMFVGMAPLTCMSSILSEEKEKNTLRALLMSNVKPVQYLLGVGSYLWLMCMAGSVVFALCGQYRGKELVVESLKLPRDSVLGDSIITVTGNTEILIENYKGILQYSDELILLQGKNRKIELKGKRLNIVYYTNEDMKISGMIESICFI